MKSIDKPSPGAWFTTLIVGSLGILSIILFLWNSSHDLYIQEEHRENMDIPVLGIHLSPSDATGVLLYRDNSITYLPQIYTSSEYRDALRRLSSESSKRWHEPYHTPTSGLPTREKIYRFIRKFRKSIGLPATGDVGLLAEPLRQIIDKATSELGYRPKDALVVTPSVLGLYDDDILDAMIYTGLGQLPLRQEYVIPNGCEEPREFLAAYAGRGGGLCSTWWDIDTCSAEDDRMWSTMHPLQTVYVIELGPAAISVGYTWKRLGSSTNVNYTENMVGIKFLDDNRDHYDWDEIKDAVREGLLKTASYDQPWISFIDQIHLIGPGAVTDDHRLETIVRDILQKHDPPIPIQKIIGTDSKEVIYAAAIGAAEIGRRGRYVTRDDLDWKLKYGGTADTPIREVKEGLQEDDHLEIKKRSNVDPDYIGCYSWYGYKLE
jgi:hypothetical protein